MATTDFGFSEDIVEAFTHGDCWELAMSLHERAGYPLVAIVDVDQEDADSVLHAAVELPNGMVVDIEGIWDAEDFIPRWYEEMSEVYGLDYNDDLDPEILSDCVLTTETRNKMSYEDTDGTITHQEIVDRILATVQSHLVANPVA